MLVGAQLLTGFGSIHNRKNESHLASGTAAGNFYGKADECGVITLSKTSLSPDPSAVVDFFGISSSSLRSRSSSNYLIGEPATPNGAGEVCCAQSPLCSSHYTRRAYVPCGRSSLDTLVENPGDGYNFARRSCSIGRDEAGDHRFLANASHQSAPVLAVRNGNHFSNAFQCKSGVQVTALGRSAWNQEAASVWEPAPGNVDSRLHQLEELLEEKCKENGTLLRQLKERDLEVAALRTEVDRLRAESENKSGLTRSDNASTGKLEPSLLSQLQRARDRLCACPSTFAPPAPATPGGPSANPAAGTSALGASGVGILLKQAPLPAMSTALWVDDCEVTALEDDCTALLRLDTPQRAGALSRKLKASSSLASEPWSPAAPGDDPPFCPSTSAVAASSNQQQEPLLPLHPTPALVLSTREDNASASLPNANAVLFGAGLGACGAPVKDSEGTRSSVWDQPRQLQQATVAAERLRTDRAHAALLFSSQQAYRLSQELWATRAHAADLWEELRDWRNACLDNHKQLAQLRRVMRAATIRTIGAVPQL